MSFTSFEDFVFIPNPEGASGGELYELKKTSDIKKNSFVLIPYQNPEIKKPVPLFFEIKSQLHIDPTSLKPVANTSLIILRSTTSKESYLKKAVQLKEQIQQGNIYEINYCIQFFAEEIDLDPLDIFLKLNGIAKAPYSCLVKLGDEYIISASPELFLKKEGNIISTKPIKGTIRRGRDAAEDEALKNELQNNLKERTENVMAVDVARNDFSRIAKKASVTVNKLYNIETFETVHQMVSTVNCELKENTSFENIIDATFPMASMTGAPKVKAMNLIDEFEDFDRNYYSGAMGMVDEKEDFILSVIIRSIFYNRKTKKLSIAVGGALTYLSDPEKEYEECLLKAEGLLKALGARLG